MNDQVECLASASPPSPFLPGTHVQFAWDSTSLGWLKQCPRLYYYSMIEGWRPKGSGVHIVFGQHYHAALELYDKYRSLEPERSHDDAVANTVWELLIWTWDKVEGKPWDSDHPAKNRFTLVRSVIWYLDQFKDDPAATLILANGKPAVELSFRMELDWGPQGQAYSNPGANAQPYILCGHLDRVVEFGGQKYVMDRKTTGSSPSPHYFEGFSPDNQMCQPEGTLVLTADGELPIEDVKENDQVYVPTRTHHQFKKMRVIAVSNRGYSGNLFTLKTRSHEHKVTPNHRCVVRLRESARNHEAVYLMKKGNQYRIGITSLRTRRDFKNGLSQRCRSENGDAMWLLAATPDREEAWAIEQLFSLRFGIPAFTFKNKSFKNFSPTKQHQLDWLWLQIGDNTSQAKKLLDILNQDLQYPIYDAKADEWSELALTRKSFVRACNLQHDIFEVAINVDGKLDWQPVIVSREEFNGTVYSLEVDKNYGTYNKGMYFANGILTGNSIYTIAAKLQFATPVAGVIIDAAQIAVGFTRFQRGFTYRTETQLEEWLTDFRFWTAQAEGFAEAGRWPMNDKACGLFGGCTFRKICSKSPEVRERFLESDFERRPWNPLETR